MNLRPLRGSNADSIPPCSRVVRIDHPAKPIKDVTVDRPIKFPEIGCSNRARRSGCAAGARGGATSSRFKSRDDIVESRLAPGQLVESLLRFLRVLLDLHE